METNSIANFNSNINHLYKWNDDIFIQPSAKHVEDLIFEVYGISSKNTAEIVVPGYSCNDIIQLPDDGVTSLTFGTRDNFDMDIPVHAFGRKIDEHFIVWTATNRQWATLDCGYLWSS